MINDVIMLSVIHADAQSWSLVCCEYFKFHFSKNTIGSWPVREISPVQMEYIVPEPVTCVRKILETVQKYFYFYPETCGWCLDTTASGPHFLLESESLVSRSSAASWQSWCRCSRHSRYKQSPIVANILKRSSIERIGSFFNLFQWMVGCSPLGNRFPWMSVNLGESSSKFPKVKSLPSHFL